MTGATLPGGATDRETRFALAVQKSRLAVYALACVIGVLGWLAGALQVQPRAGLIHLAVSVVTAVLFHELYRHRVDRRLGLDLRPAWMGLDVVLITLAVSLSGGLDSPLYPWYLANVAAAAFVGGRRAALVVACADAAAYVTALVALGQVRGLDAGLALAGLRLAVLGSAAFFFVRGLLELQEEQRLVVRLRDEQAAQVDRLTALAQDLDQGTRALAEANIQIREADHLKSQFLANMSHELRTPLNSIIGFSEILGDRLAEQISPRHLKFLHNIQASGQHLLGIINDILDLSKIESGKMELLSEPLRVPTIVEGVLSVMHGMAAGRRIVLEVQAPAELPTLEADPAKLKQVLYNLVSNAVKFSPEGGTVRVEARHVSAADSPLGAESLTVSVIDHGIGIAPSDQQVVFNEFHQVDSAASRGYGGTGLGLALVKKLVELHRGVVSLSSVLGEGSTFSFTLPLRAGEIGPDAPEKEPRGRPGEHRVLVVEDDLLAYQFLARTLAGAGYTPVRARHGEEALALARSIDPVAVTLDLALPDFSGWDVLKALKREEATASVPVVIVSMMDNRELGLALGADDYMLKPVDPERLVARLTQIAPLPARRSRLLLIDDDPVVHELLEAELGDVGYVLEHALSGAAGLRQASLCAPDVVILDLMMPDVTGFEVAAALRARPETAHVPVVVLTAKDLDADERASLQGRIAALVQKGGSTAGDLVSAIRELETRHGRAAARA